MEFTPGTDYPTKRLVKQKSLDAGLFALQGIDDFSAPSSFQAVVEEFNSLQLLTDKPMSFGERILTYPSATTFFTASKNRYPDILPKEETRVLLKNTGVDGSEYINANFVFDKQYIATQAPIPTTFCDFWRMVWEQETTVIVMLTKLTERKQVRAAIYWPQRVGESAQ
jgi:protein tyrosine phosphatase